MAKQLRPYQIDMIKKIYEQWDSDIKNVLLVLPTGMGKTFSFCSIAIDKAIKAENKLATAIMVHRKELVSQICLTLAEEGIYHNIIAPRNVIKGIVAAERQEYKKSFYDYNATVTVISVDTLNARILKHEAWAKSIRLWITDEAAHLLKTNKWGRAIGYFPNAIGLGVTATPQRLDKRGLGSHVDGVFDAMVEGPGTKWGIDNGHLCKYKVVIPESDYKLYLKEATGDSDYSKEAMASASQKSHIVGDVVANYIKFSKGKQAIVFASDIAAGERMEGEYIDAGIAAKLLTGMTDDSVRLKAMRDYREKKIQVLINVDLFDEGLDVPGIECVIMARPTMSLGKYLQMCLDEKTEILTQDGWKSHETIVESDLVAGFNTENGEIEWCEIEETVNRPRNENETMFAYSSPNLDIRVTSQHDMVVKCRSKTTKNWIKETVDCSNKRKESYRIPVSGVQKTKPANITDDEIRFMGWFLTDGTKNKISQTIVLYQAESHPEHISHIRKTLKGCNFKYSEYRHVRRDHMSVYSPMIHFSVSKSRPVRAFKTWADPSLRGWEHLQPWIDKNLPDIYDSLDERQVDILLETLHMGDGYKRKPHGWTSRTTSITCGDNRIFADRLQSLLIRKGYRCNLAVEKRPRPLKDIYNLHCKKIKTSSVTGSNVRDGSISNKKSYKRARWVKETTYREETVWCVKNRLGTLITRRNGKVAVLGNCGRGLRVAKDKPFLIIIDHVGNISKHGLPDARRKWSLDRPSKKKKKLNLIRICRNFMCNAVYDRLLSECPYCGTKDEPRKPGDGGGRVGPSTVDGDLMMIDPDTLRELEANTHLEDPMRVAARVAFATRNEHAGTKAMNNQIDRIATQKHLAETCALWAGKMRDKGLTDRMIHKEFYIKFDKTITEALADKRVDMIETIGELEGDL